VQDHSSLEERGVASDLSACEKVDQFIARESRLPQQRQKSSFWQIAIVARNDRSTVRRRVIEDEVAARGVIQDETVLLQKADDLAWFDGGYLWHRLDTISRFSDKTNGKGGTCRTMSAPLSERFL
jgi:hypothetical protein